MSSLPQQAVRVVIACGGTGGHLFPGLAVAEQLVQHGCDPMLLVSAKAVDQQALERVSGVEVFALPAVGLTRGRELAFIRGFMQSYRAAAQLFKARPPHVVLAMGGFTSAPPILAGKRVGARTFLHESNAVSGRANRWLSRVVDGAFVSFPAAASRLRQRSVTVTGTPVRSCFRACDVGLCRAELGLDPAHPVLLVMGGSQGARGVNGLMLASLPLLARRGPKWQWIHLAGTNDADKLNHAYAASGLTAKVHSFFSAMDVALGAATAAVCRAGASSLAELAAMRVPAVLVPYPAAADNHQLHNARALVATGAAYLLEERNATPEMLVPLLSNLVEKPAVREEMQSALAQWHAARAAEEIAEAMLVVAGAESGKDFRADRQAVASPEVATKGGEVDPKTSRPSPSAWMPRRHGVARSATLVAGRGA